MTSAFSRFKKTHNAAPRRQKAAALFPLVALAAASFFFSAPSYAHDDGNRSAKPFGPFAAGQKRKVTRQGKKGIAREPHPVVGTVAKVPGEGPPAPPLRRDADIPEDAIRTANRIGPSLSSNPLWLFALTYHHLVTRIDGPKCGHYPTCSHLANQAVARYGPLGIFIGLDRIIQPPVSSSLRPHPQVAFPQLTRAFDPLSNYEFWKPSFSPMPPKTEESPLLFEEIETASKNVVPVPPSSSAETDDAKNPAKTSSTDDKAQPATQNLPPSKNIEAS